MSFTTKQALAIYCLVRATILLGLLILPVELASLPVIMFLLSCNGSRSKMQALSSLTP
jgi:hypothetical protein